MSDNVIDIFDRYSPKKRGQQADSSSGATREIYKAADIEDGNRRALRIRIHFSDGTVDLRSYGALASVYSVSPNYLSFVFKSGLVYMQGENLQALLDDFQEERVRAVYPFDPTRHIEPAKETPIIRSIEWKVPARKTVQE